MANFKKVIEIIAVLIGGIIITYLLRKANSTITNKTVDTIKNIWNR